MSRSIQFSPLTGTALRGALVFAIGLATSMACRSSSLNPDHCFNTLGDSTCADKYPDGTRPFCGVGTCFPDVEDGCVEARPDTDDCYSPCGDRMTAEDDLSCATAEDSSDTGTMTIGDDDDDDDDDSTTVGDDDDDDSTTMGDDDDDDTGPMPCMDDDECDQGNQLFCVDEMCVDCTATPDGDAACAEANADRPACNDMGACVQCTDANAAACDGDTPVCDAEAFECRECVEHSECPDSACKIRHDSETKGSVGLGACFDPADVVTVNNDMGGDFPSIDAALSSIGDGDDLVIILEQANNYDEAVAFGSGQNQDVAILAAPGENPNWIQGGNMAGPHITINASGRLWLHDVEVRANQDSGVAAIRVNAGRLHVQRSRIVANLGGGILVENMGFAVVENSFVSGTADGAALSADNSDVYLLYSSLGRVFTTTEFVVECSGGSVDVRNCLVVNQSSEGGNEVCASATVTTSVEMTDLDPAGQWMSGFNTGDYTLTTPPAAWLTAATWLEGDPATDIDDTERPGIDGTEDVAGAHIPE